MIELITRICSKCGEEKPLTVEFFRKRKELGEGRFRGVCKECQHKREGEIRIVRDAELREYRKKYYEDNHERILNNKSDYYRRNKELIAYKQYVLKREQTLAASNRYKELNKDKIKDYRKEYNSRPEVILREKQRRIDEREKDREYQKNYLNTEKGREKSIIKVAKRRALRNNTISTFTVVQWEESKEFFKFECAYCGLKANKFDQDHIVPLSKGGSHVKSNIIPSCEYCNGSKHVKDMEYWYGMQPFFSEDRLKTIQLWIELNKSEYEEEVEQLENYAT